jgi:hypothetical protein
VPDATFLKGWWPGLLFLGSIIVGAITRVDPWIIGAVTGSLMLIGFFAEWRVQRARRRREESEEAGTRPRP